MHKCTYKDVGRHKCTYKDIWEGTNVHTKIWEGTHVHTKIWEGWLPWAQGDYSPPSTTLNRLSSKVDINHSIWATSIVSEIFEDKTVRISCSFYVQLSVNSMGYVWQICTYHISLSCVRRQHLGLSIVQNRLTLHDLTLNNYNNNYRCSTSVLLGYLRACQSNMPSLPIFNTICRKKHARIHRLLKICLVKTMLVSKLQAISDALYICTYMYVHIQHVETYFWGEH